MLGAEPVPVPAGDDGEPVWPAKLGRFPIAVDASGQHGGLHATIRSTAANGICTSTAGAIYAAGDVPLPVLEMYRQSVTFRTGWVHTRPLMHAPLELIRDGRFDPGPAFDAVLPFDDAAARLAEPFTKLGFHA